MSQVVGGQAVAVPDKACLDVALHRRERNLCELGLCDIPVVCPNATVQDQCVSGGGPGPFFYAVGRKCCLCRQVGTSQRKQKYYTNFPHGLGKNTKYLFISVLIDYICGN